MISNNKKIVRNFNNSNYSILKTLLPSYKHEYVLFYYTTDIYLRVFKSKELESSSAEYIQGTFFIVKNELYVHL